MITFLLLLICTLVRGGWPERWRSWGGYFPCVMEQGSARMAASPLCFVGFILFVDTFIFDYIPSSASVTKQVTRP